MSSASNQRNLLLLSSSRYCEYGMLEFGEAIIRDFLGDERRILYLPYAVVIEDRAGFIQGVQERFTTLGHDLVSVEEMENPLAALNEFDAVAVNGGNTFQLLHCLHKYQLVNAIRKRVHDGMLYMGWSAGANVACPTLCTTNDMPIVQPESFSALNLVPFQINAHFTDTMPEGHRGETRRMRIEEFLRLNPGKMVIGLPEGNMLRIHGDSISAYGEHPLVVFRANETAQEIAVDDDLSFLLS
ncbi:MAG: dipeptidase PepE [Gammaproteobacteria bacterium]